jgi:hypothetical protein
MDVVQGEHQHQRFWEGHLMQYIMHQHDLYTCVENTYQGGGHTVLSGLWLGKGWIRQ